jgi:glycerophosphocholine phosphodiesterase GPCPD1
MARINVLAADGKQTYSLKVPVSDLTLAELGTFNVSKCQDSIVTALVNEGEQMFPTLRRCFEAVDPKIGFNIEVKYCMHLRSTGQYEEGIQHFAERNSYIDIILRDIFQHAGNRPIVLSCFDPDICTMMRAKQTCYPVVFLSQGETLKYATFQDPRSATLALAVSFAVSESLTGVALHTEDLLKDLPLITRAHSNGLAVFSWGVDNNNMQNLELQRKHQMDGMIYDRLDEFKVMATGEE